MKTRNSKLLQLGIIVRDCPAGCDEGYVIYTGGPGYFDREFGNYLPSETESVCEECYGEGTIEDEMSDEEMEDAVILLLKDGLFQEAENLAKAYNCDIDNLFEEAFPYLLTTLEKHDESQYHPLPYDIER